MTCDPDRLAVFLAGELSPGEAAQMDEHLLRCEECWQAAREDAAGRGAAGRLREAVPEGLEERVRAAVLTASTTGSTTVLRPVRRWRAVVVAAVAIGIAVIAGIGVHGGASQPTTLEQALAEATAGAPLARMDAYAVDGTPILVARPSQPLAMPAGGSHPALSDAAWVMHHGGVTVVCTRTTGIVIAGRASPERLLAFARRLALA